MFRQEKVTLNNIHEQSLIIPAKPIITWLNYKAKFIMCVPTAPHTLFRSLLSSWLADLQIDVFLSLAMKQVEELLADLLKTDTALTHSMKRPTERAKKEYGKVHRVRHMLFQFYGSKN